MMPLTLHEDTMKRFYPHDDVHMSKKTFFDDGLVAFFDDSPPSLKKMCSLVILPFFVM